MVKHLPFSNSLTLSVSSAVSFSSERRGAEYANTIQKTVPQNLAHSLRSRGLLASGSRQSPSISQARLQRAQRLCWKTLSHHVWRLQQTLKKSAISFSLFFVVSVHGEKMSVHFSWLIAMSLKRTWVIGRATLRRMSPKQFPLKFL